MKLTRTQKDHILKNNSGDIIYNGNPYWLISKSKIGDNVVLINSAGDIKTIDRKEVYNVLKSKAVVTFDGEHISLLSFCERVNINSDIIYMGLLKLTDSFTYNIMKG